MGADYLSYVKSIATYAPEFFWYNNSVLARVSLLPPCKASETYSIQNVFSGLLVKDRGHGLFEKNEMLWILFETFKNLQEASIL